MIFREPRDNIVAKVNTIILVDLLSSGPGDKGQTICESSFEASKNSWSIRTFFPPYW